MAQGRQTLPLLSALLLLLETRHIAVAFVVRPTPSRTFCCPWLGNPSTMWSTATTTTSTNTISTTSATALEALPEWKIFVDLQCPFAKKAWERYPLLKERFGNDYKMTMHLTSLVFHPQAFVGQQAAYLIEQQTNNKDKKQAFVDACFQNQDRFKRDALGEDYSKLQVDAIFADIAQQAGVFDQDKFTREYFLQHLHDWEQVIKPAYGEVKVALSYGVFGTPKHVINEKLVMDTESTWGPDEWEQKLNELQQQTSIETDDVRT